jgi:hypothetical protein
MSVWRWESELMTSVISRFPRMVTWYMDRKRLKMRGHSSESCVSPRRRISDIVVWFLGCMLLAKFMEMIGSK